MLMCPCYCVQLVCAPASSVEKPSLVQVLPKKLRLPTDSEALTFATSPAGTLCFHSCLVGFGEFTRIIDDSRLIVH